MKILSSLSPQQAVFARLVETLRDCRKSITVVESSCGGLIQSQIMAVPGSSRVFKGGIVAYDSTWAKENGMLDIDKGFSGSTGSLAYKESKIEWTRRAAIKQSELAPLALAEAGAMGPTFRPNDMDTGFSALCIAENGQILAEKVVETETSDRSTSMQIVAEEAANLIVDVLLTRKTSIIDRTPVEVNEDARFLVLNKQNQILLNKDNQGLEMLDHDDLFHLLQQKLTLDHAQNNCFFLGTTELTNSTKSVSVFATKLAPHVENDQDMNCKGHFVSGRAAIPLLRTETERKLLFHALALSNFRDQHQYCAACGGAMRPANNGSCLQCSSCNKIEHCRQDPCVITLVTSPSRIDQRALLLKHKRHPPGVYTCCAGFVEAGESLEDAVLREAYEETGLVLDPDSLHFIKSQAWPFPRSTMAGFTARCLDSARLKLDPSEIEGALWLSREDLRQVTSISADRSVLDPHVAAALLREYPSLPCLVPPTGVLARTLIDFWLAK